MRSFGLFVEISVVLAFACVICGQLVTPPDHATNGTQSAPANSSIPEVPKLPNAPPVSPGNSSETNITTTPPPTQPTPAPTTPTPLPTTTTTTTKPPTPVTTTKPPTPAPVPTTNATTVAPVTTALPFQAPTTMIPDRSFDGLSFIGGMVLAIGLMAIAGVAFKFYRAREGNPNYFTL